MNAANTPKVHYRARVNRDLLVDKVASFMVERLNIYLEQFDPITGNALMNHLSASYCDDDTSLFSLAFNIDASKAPQYTVLREEFCANHGIIED